MNQKMVANELGVKPSTIALNWEGILPKEVWQVGIIWLLTFKLEWISDTTINLNWFGLIQR